MRWREVNCDDCGEALTPVFADLSVDDGGWKHLQAEGALHVRFDGGDGELIDVFGPDVHDEAPEAILCAACARKLIDAHPWIAELVGNWVNINYAHRCVDRGLVWEPMPRCDQHPLTHGWRKVWLVGNIETSELTGRRAQRPRAWAWGRQAAELAAEPGEEVRESLIGNLNHTPLAGTGPVDPDDGPEIEWREHDGVMRAETLGYQDRPVRP